MPVFPMSQHIVVNKTVVIDGDRATARSAVFDPMGLPDRNGLLVFFEGAYYDDKLVRTPDGWRISERIEVTSYSTRLQRVMTP
jgi:hypothetical protein